MSSTTPVSGVPIPVNTNILSAEEAFGEYARGVDTLGAPRFISAASRDAGFSGASTPGALSVVTQTLGNNAVIEMYDGTSWRDIEDEYIVAKTSNQSVTSTTLVDLTELQFANPYYSGVYNFELILLVTGPAAANIKLQMVTDSALVSAMEVFALATTATTRTGNVTANLQSTGFNLNVGTGGGPTFLYACGGVSTAAAGGTIKFQFGQISANASPITIETGSYLRVNKD